MRPLPDSQLAFIALSLPLPSLAFQHWQSQILIFDWEKKNCVYSGSSLGQDWIVAFFLLIFFGSCSTCHSWIYLFIFFTFLSFYLFIFLSFSLSIFFIFFPFPFSSLAAAPSAMVGFIHLQFFPQSRKMSNSLYCPLAKVHSSHIFTFSYVYRIDNVDILVSPVLSSLLQDY